MSSDLVETLKSNIEKLMEKCEESQQSNLLLKKEIADLQLLIQQKQLEHEELVSKYKLLQMAKSLSGESSGSGDVKAKIHNLVREIDKCIALLNR